MERRKLFRKSTILFAGMAGAVILLNVAAWNSSAFSDWYIANIFPVWVTTYGLITGLFPFSVGEWMLGAGLALVGLALVLGLIWIGIGALKVASPGMAFTGKGMYIFGRLTKGFYRFLSGCWSVSVWL